MVCPPGTRTSWGRWRLVSLSCFLVGWAYQVVLAGEDGAVLLVAVRDYARTVGLCLAAQPEVGARGCQWEEVDGRGGASGHDTKGAIGDFGRRLAHAGEGRGQRDEREEQGDLHGEKQ